MIQIKDFGFRYAGQEEFALKDLNLDIEEGDFLGVIGPSGAGKSTFTYALNGVIPHHYRGDFYGSVTVCGMDTVETRPEELARRVGSVFQDIDGQMVSSVVEDELLFALENFGVPENQVEERLREAMDLVGISHLRDRDLATLSGGQKQKVAICAMAALRPKILVLDEPTGELDPGSSRQIYEMLRKLNRELKLTVVVVEQKIMLLCEYAERLLVLSGGQARFHGPVREVLESAAGLERLGVNCPRVVTLADRLRERGLYRGPVPVDLLEAEKMAREVLG